MLNGDVQAVLLVPKGKDALGLLKDGPYGARPSVAERVHGSDPGEPDEGDYDYGWTPGWRDNWRGMSHEFGEAYQRGLVLAWKGEVVVGSMARIETLLESGDCDEVPGWRHLTRIVRSLLRGDLRTMGLLRRRLGDLGDLVFLDSESREVTEGRNSPSGGSEAELSG